MKCYKLPIENNKGCSIYHGILFSRSKDVLSKVNGELFSLGIIDEMWGALEEKDIDISLTPEDAEGSIRKAARWFGLYGAMADQYAAISDYHEAITSLVNDMEEKSRIIVSKLSDGKVRM
ncbi:MAG: hypothetical protein IJG64_02510 [Oscillospiraceae bacterium]|nr:hypothetical protein [Oscillospiraceae bacterium]